MSFNPLRPKPVVAWLPIVIGSAAWNFAMAEDTRTDGEYDRLPNEAGSCVKFSLSIGDGGRGSAKLNLDGDQIGGVVETLRSWDPEVVNPENLTPGQIVARTIEAEYGEVPEGSPEGTKPPIVAVKFLTSLAKHSRTIRVPFEDFQGFVDFLAEAADADAIEACVNYYRGQREEIEKADAAKAAKAAELRAKAEGTPAK